MRRLIGLVVTCCLGLVALGAVEAMAAEPGSLDRSFGYDGLWYEPGAHSTYGAYGPLAEDMAVGPEDDIFVLQSYRDCRDQICTVEFFVQRHLPDGLLDEGFGQEGSTARVTVSARSVRGNAFGSLAVNPQGEAVVATTDRGDLTLFRFDASGRLSTGFGAGGVVTSDFGADVSVPAVAIDGEGNIVIAGGSAQGPRRSVVLARYFSDGALDPTFGTGQRERRGPGWLTIPGAAPGALALFGNGGSIVAGARCCTRKETTAVYWSRRDRGGHALGGTGPARPWRYLRVGRNAWISSVIALPHGKIALVGGRGERPFAARLRRNGRLDRSFGERRGLTWFSKMTTGSSPAIADGGGRLYLAGDRPSPEEYVAPRALIARLTASGRHDRRWGHSPAGYALTGGPMSNVVSLDFQSNGRLVVFGEFSGDCIRSCSMPSRLLARVIVG